MKKALLFLATIVAAASCTNDVNVTPEINGSKQVTVSVSTSSAIDTRIALSENENGGYTATWSIDDKLGAWSEGDVALSEFEIDVYGETSSTFKGGFSDGAEYVRFVYPYSTDAVADSKLAIDLSSQTAEADLAHLSATTYMMSEYMAITAASSGVGLSHIGAVADIRIKCSEAVDMSLKSIAISGDMIPTTASVDLTADIEDDYITVDSYGTISVDVPNFTADGGIFEVPVSIIPFEIAAGESVKLVATFEDAAGNTMVGTREIAAGSDTSFSRATRNYLNFVISDELAPLREKEVAISAFSNDASESEFTVTTGELEFAWDANGSSLYPKYNSSGYIQLYSKNKVVISTTNGLPITGITYTYYSSYSDKAKLLECTPGSLDVQSTSTTWSGLSESVEIVNGGTAQVQIRSITVTYASYEVDTVITGSAADIYTTEDGEAFILEDATVDYIYGIYVYAHTSDNVSALIYTALDNVNVGDIITVEGTISSYNGVKQLIDAEVTEQTTGGTAIAATEITVEEFTTNYTQYLNQYICLKGVTVSGTTVSQDDSSTAYYDSFKLEECPTAATCDIYGYGSYYSSPQIYPTAFENVVEIPVFSALSSSSISFTSTDTEAQSVTMTGENLDDDTQFTVTNSDTTNFTVTYTSGTSFTVAPTAANNSDAEYTATITVKLGDVEKELSVTQYSSNVTVYAYTLIEDVADIEDGEYLLACEYSNDWYMAIGSEPTKASGGYLQSDSSVAVYYDSSTKSFSDNITIAGYAVTITVSDDSSTCTVKLGDGTFINGINKTTMDFNSTEYEWNIVSDDANGVYLHESNSDSKRSLAMNSSTTDKRFSAYDASNAQYYAANLYKKVVVE